MSKVLEAHWGRGLWLGHPPAEKGSSSKRAGVSCLVLGVRLVYFRLQCGCLDLRLISINCLKKGLTCGLDLIGKIFCI